MLYNQEELDYWISEYPELTVEEIIDIIQLIDDFNGDD